MANKRIIELNERTVINMGDYLMVDDATGSRKLAMSTLFNYLTYSSLMFVDTLPTTDIDPTVIYLVPHSGSTTQWDEYIYRDNQWILIGTSTLDLTSIYQTKTDNNLQTTSKQIVGAINEVKTALPTSEDINVTLEGGNTKLMAKRYGNVVTLSLSVGATVSTGNEANIGTVSAGNRPSHTIGTAVVTNTGKTGYLRVYDNGNITVEPTANNWSADGGLVSITYIV